MTPWLQKITSSISAGPKSRNLPAVRRGQVPGTLKSSRVQTAPPLPNASVVYGIASSALFVFGIYFGFTGRWVTAILVCVLGACFLGFALHFLKR